MHPFTIKPESFDPFTGRLVYKINQTFFLGKILEILRVNFAKDFGVRWTPKIGPAFKL